MSVTRMSHRDVPVTPIECHAVSHVPQRSVPPTRPDPTRPISVVAVVCGVSGSGFHPSHGEFRVAVAAKADEKQRLAGVEF